MGGTRSVDPSIHIRPGVETDLPGLTELYNHYVRQSPATFDIDPFTIEQRRTGWFVRYPLTGPHRLFVAEARGDLLGYGTTSPIASKAGYAASVETSIYCRPDAVGRGIGTMLTRTLLDALACEDVHRVYCCITLPNQASTVLHLRFGFREVGVFREVGRKFGRWWDVLWMEKPMADYGRDSDESTSR